MRERIERRRETHRAGARDGWLSIFGNVEPACAVLVTFTRLRAASRLFPASSSH